MCLQLQNSGLLPSGTESASFHCWSRAKGHFPVLSFFCRPINGGQDCPGVNFEYQLCNTEECQKHFEDFRGQQCQQRNSHFEYHNTKHHWLPYEHPDCEWSGPSLSFPLCGWELQRLSLVHTNPLDSWHLVGNLENLVFIGVSPAGF